MSNYSLTDFEKLVKTEIKEEVIYLTRDFIKQQGKAEAEEILNTYPKLNPLEIAKELKESLQSQYLQEDEIEVGEALYRVVENEVIYYADCWAIAQRLSLTDFEITSTGETAKDICELAFCGLVDYFHEEVNEQELVNEAIKEAFKELNTLFIDVATELFYNV